MVQANETDVENRLQQVEQRQGAIIEAIAASDKNLTAAEDAVTAATEETEKAEADAAAEQEAETGALLQLVSLIQEEHRVLHESLQESHKNNTARLASHEATLQALTQSGVHANSSCDAARASVIQAKAKLQLTNTALQGCLQAKKEIKAKIAMAIQLG